MAAVPPPTDLPLLRGARPSLRSVAKAAGVSAMTVSRVLRDHPKVSAAVRALVHKAARELNYRPDPNVAKLMHHLRLRRKPAFQASICAITTVPPGTPFQGYISEIFRGAQRQAEARGYGFSMVHVGETRSPQGLQRMLRSRGVEGVMLLPMQEPASLDDLLEWNEVSVVSTTSSVLAPDLHSVMPHHFKNGQLLCRQLNARGYRRIGLALRDSHVARVYHAYNAAITWHGMFNDSAFVPPMIYTGQEPAGLVEWFEREQPDVVVTHMARLAERFAEILGRKLGGDVGFASTNTVPGSPITGVDELPVEIGATAVDLLISMIQRGEKGVPLTPASTLLLGHWVDGTSCPVKPGRPVAPVDRAAQPRMIYREA